MLMKGQHLLFLLILTSVFYIAKLTQFSPVYLLQPVLSLVLLLILVHNNQQVSMFGLMLVFFAAIYFSFNTLFFSTRYSTYVNFLSGLISFFVLTNSHHYFSTSVTLNVITRASKCILWILCVDSLYRILNPSMPTPEALEAVKDTEYAFYMYKFGTFMFSDSNTVAIICVSFFFLLDYCHKRFGINTFVLRVLFFIIMLSCLSRSAIFATIISIFLLNAKISLRFKIALVACVLLPVVVYILSSFVNDGSFMSKLHILQEFFNYLGIADLSSILLGVGLDNSPLYLNNIYSHIHFVTSIVEGGVIGSLLIVLFLSYYTYVTRYKCLYVVIPNLILGCSYFFYLGSPFVFVPMALVVMLELQLSKVEV